MSEPIPLKPERASEKVDKDPIEKALRKAELERGLMSPSDRYRALVNAVKAAQDLIELADKKARFALVIMSVLNAAAILLIARGGENLIPKKGFAAVLIGLELAAYVSITIFYVWQAISTLRPRGVPNILAVSLPKTIEPATSMRMLFYADVVARDRASYRETWEQLRMDNLTVELADQLYTLSWINSQKYLSLQKLYFGLSLMTVALGSMIGTIAFFKLVF